MALRLSTGLRNMLLGTASFKTIMQNGVIRIFPGVQPASFTAIPFFAHANRQPTEMMVWLAESPFQRH